MAPGWAPIILCPGAPLCEMPFFFYHSLTGQMRVTRENIFHSDWEIYYLWRERRHLIRLSSFIKLYTITKISLHTIYLGCIINDFLKYCGVFTPCKNCNIETRSRDYATADEVVFSLCRAKQSQAEPSRAAISTWIMQEWGRVTWLRQQWCNN
jgi:hypothetical protein